MENTLLNRYSCQGDGLIMRQAEDTVQLDTLEDSGKSFSQHCPHLSKGNNFLVFQRHSELPDLYADTCHALKLYNVLITITFNQVFY